MRWGFLGLGIVLAVLGIFLFLISYTKISDCLVQGYSAFSSDCYAMQSSGYRAFHGFSAPSNSLVLGDVVLEIVGGTLTVIGLILTVASLGGRTERKKV